MIRHVYARHAPAVSWCIVDRIEVGTQGGGSYVTACRGRWPLNDPKELSIAPDVLCDECVRVKEGR